MKRFEAEEKYLLFLTVPGMSIVFDSSTKFPVCKTQCLVYSIRSIVCHKTGFFFILHAYGH